MSDKKAFHDQHIKNKQFHIGDLVLQYDSNFLKQPGNLRAHRLGPYIVIQIIVGGVVKLKKLDGTPFKGLVNEIQLKPYQDSHNFIYLELKKSWKKWWEMRKEKGENKQEKEKDKN